MYRWAHAGQTPVVQESTVLIKELCYKNSFLFQFKAHNAFSHRIIVIVVRSPKTPLTQVTMGSSEYSIVP